MCLQPIFSRRSRAQIANTTHQTVNGEAIERRLPGPMAAPLPTVEETKKSVLSSNLSKLICEHAPARILEADKGSLSKPSHRKKRPALTEAAAQKDNTGETLHGTFLNILDSLTS